MRLTFGFAYNTDYDNLNCYSMYSVFSHPRGYTLRSALKVPRGRGEAPSRSRSRAASIKNHHRPCISIIIVVV